MILQRCAKKKNWRHATARADVCNGCPGGQEERCEICHVIFGVGQNGGRIARSEDGPIPPCSASRELKLWAPVQWVETDEVGSSRVHRSCFCSRRSSKNCIKQECTSTARPSSRAAPRPVSFKSWRRRSRTLGRTTFVKSVCAIHARSVRVESGCKVVSITITMTLREVHPTTVSGLALQAWVKGS